MRQKGLCFVNGLRVQPEFGFPSHAVLGIHFFDARDDEFDEIRFCYGFEPCLSLHLFVERIESSEMAELPVF